MRRRVLLVVLFAQLLLILPAQAQIDAGLTNSDFNTFFQWFNDIFQTLLPIALVGAGIVAGAAFLYIIVSMIARVFGRGGGADDLEFVDPLNPSGMSYRDYAALQREDGKTPVSEDAWNQYYRRLEILNESRQAAVEGKYDVKREFVYGLDKEKRIKLEPWERRFLLRYGNELDETPLTREQRKDRRLFRRELREGIAFYNNSPGAQWRDPIAPQQKRKKKGKREPVDDIFAPMLGGSRGKKRRQQLDLFSPDSFGGGRGRRGRENNVIDLFPAPTRSARGRRGGIDDFNVLGRPPSLGRGGGRGNSVMDFVFFGDSAPRRRRRR